MTERQALVLKDIFYRIKQFYFGVSEKPLSAANLTSGEATEYVAALREAEQTLFLPEEGRALPEDAEVMLRRASALTREALTEGDIHLAGDLSALTVRLIGVYVFPYMSRRRFASRCLRPFREEHGTHFFAEEESLFLASPDARFRFRPFFRPATEGHYYDDDADSALREAHPVLHGLFLAFGVLLFLGAIIAYALLAPVIVGKTGPSFLLGFLGMGAFAIGLYSIALAFIRQFMGRVLTPVLLIGGAILTALSFLLAL